MCVIRSEGTDQLMRPKDGTPRGPAAGAVGAACGAPVGRTLTTQPKRRCNSARQRTVQPQAGSTGRRVCTETSTARTTRHATPALHQPTCEMLAQPGDWGPTSAGSAIQYCRGGREGTRGRGTGGVLYAAREAGVECGTQASAQVQRMLSCGAAGRAPALHRPLPDSLPTHPPLRRAARRRPAGRQPGLLGRSCRGVAQLYRTNM